ncbi:MAG TPA: hypothetical protein VNS58_11160 [Puia sp.]|jgi:hypothetical protein|nr:hypothetical protein [Puia sp.]
MNTNFVSTRVVKAITVAVAAIVLFVSNPLTSQANGGKKTAILSEEQVTVQYVGTNDNSVVFRVQLENPTASKFWLIIKNDNGEVVYRKQFSDAHFVKSVYFQKEEADIHPTFVIRSSENEIVRQFAVNRTVTENTVVTKL